MITAVVESTTLRTIGYDESLALLRLEFRSLAVYDYFGVPSAVHGSLLGACPSIRKSTRLATTSSGHNVSAARHMGVPGNTRTGS